MLGRAGGTPLAGRVAPLLLHARPMRPVHAVMLGDVDRSSTHLFASTSDSTALLAQELLSGLVSESRQPKVVVLPRDATVASPAPGAHPSAGLPLTSPGQPLLVRGQGDVVALLQRGGPGPHGGAAALEHLPAADLQRRPWLLPFGAMLQELRRFCQQHLASHVPRHCFDDAVLGAWVRFARRARRKGDLARWQVEALDEIGFEWAPTRVEAQWHHLYHQARRLKMLHGRLDAGSPPAAAASSSGDAAAAGAAAAAASSVATDPEWAEVSRWLRRQTRLLLREKLPQRKLAMLRALGVTLQVCNLLVAGGCRVTLAGFEGQSCTRGTPTRLTLSLPAFFTGRTLDDPHATRSSSSSPTGSSRRAVQVLAATRPECARTQARAAAVACCTRAAPGPREGGGAGEGGGRGGESGRAGAGAPARSGQAPAAQAASVARGHPGLPATLQQQCRVSW